MSLFIVRVELHGAVYNSDYDILHTAMANAGFNRIITADNGKKYFLPTAEYVMSSNTTRSQILSLAKNAAAMTGKTFGVLVVEGGCTWEGLDPVK